MDLIEGLTDGDPSALELNVHQWKAIDEDGHIIAVGVASCLLHLVDHLHLVT